MATSVASSASALSITGLASGIDTSTIIEGLTKLNQSRLSDLQNRQSAVSLKLTAFGGIQATLLDLQSKLTRLARSVNGAFDGRSATSSDDTILKAAAGAAAQPGTYTLQVQSLARAAQVASTGFTDANATIQQGTVTIRVGTGTGTNVTIDSSNNTLQGLATAINASGADVRATVINDGTATPYRLLLSSTKTGAANTIQITNNLSSGTGATIDLTNSVVQTSADATILVGSGAGAITINSASNQVDNVIAGVSVNLVKAVPNQPVMLTIAADTKAAHQAISDFVDSYNAAIDFIHQRNTFDAKSQTGGVLLGNSDVQSLESDLADALVRSVGGVNTKANRLSAIGITFGDDNKLVLDSGKLDAALGGQVAGVTTSDFKRLFALSAQSTNAGVSFVIGNDRTKPSGNTPFLVDITQAATSAHLVGTDDVVDNVIDSTNNSFRVSVNGVGHSLLTLDEGTYDPTQLAAAIQAKINADPALSGNQVAVSIENNKLSISSLTYGSASKVAFTGGTAIVPGGPFGLSGPVSAQGTDVAGRFIVNGQTETATGFGQVLTGSSGNSNTDGLQVRVTLSSSEVVSGAEANLTVTQGIASRLNQVLNRYLDPTKGRLKSVSDAFQKQIDDIGDTIEKQNDLIDAKKAQLAAQFAAMEQSINSIKLLSDQLTARFSTSTSTK